MPTKHVTTAAQVKLTIQFWDQAVHQSCHKCAQMETTSNPDPRLPILASSCPPQSGNILSPKSQTLPSNNTTQPCIDHLWYTIPSASWMVKTTPAWDTSLLSCCDRLTGQKANNMFQALVTGLVSQKCIHACKELPSPHPPPNPSPEGLGLCSACQKMQRVCCHRKPVRVTRHIRSNHLGDATFSLSCRSGQPSNRQRSKKKETTSPKHLWTDGQNACHWMLESFRGKRKRKRNGKSSQERTEFPKVSPSKWPDWLKDNGWLLEGFCGKQRNEGKLVSYGSLARCSVGLPWKLYT